MRSSLKLLALGAVLAIGAAGSLGALAAGNEQIIKDRQALMKQQSGDLKAVKAYIDGKADQAKATAAVTNLIKDLEKIPSVFPPGSAGPNPEGKYAPKAEVWSDWQGFLAARDTAVAKAGTLLTAVKTGDKASIQAVFADIGKNGCGACHGKFRETLKK
jgi:cytochrome c556